MSERYERAYEAFSGERFKFVVSLMITLQEIDDKEYRKMHGDDPEYYSLNDLLDMPDEKVDTTKRALFDSLEARLMHTNQLTGVNRRLKPKYGLSELVLFALDDATCDALMVVMYAGRDGDAELPHAHDRYPEDQIRRQFAEWWDYLSMDREFYVRQMIVEKVLKDRYWKNGMHMFRIDER